MIYLNGDEKKRLFTFRARAVEGVRCRQNWENIWDHAQKMPRLDMDQRWLKFYEIFRWKTQFKLVHLRDFKTLQSLSQNQTYFCNYVQTKAFSNFTTTSCHHQLRPITLKTTKSLVNNNKSLEKTCWISNRLLIFFPFP